MLQSLPPYLLAPTVFLGLLVTLWLYKSLMLVLFQDKIVYMPYMPPFTRDEKVADYVTVCRPVVWREDVLVVGDGVRVGVCVGRVDDEGREERKKAVLCYFHGNGGSLPPRLPMLSNVLKTIHATAGGPDHDVEYSLVALSYRGYWTSSGKPSQLGIEADAQALLRWVNDTYIPSLNTRAGDVQLILWGQSLGAGVATTAAATYAANNRAPITALVLETPFTSIESMLLALYPQKWLPYRYLGPFLRSHWDSARALKLLAASGQPQRPRVLVLAAGNDEVVPAGEAGELERVCREAGLEVAGRRVRGALHHEASGKGEGRRVVGEFVVGVVENGTTG